MIKELKRFTLVFLLAILAMVYMPWIIEAETIEIMNIKVDSKQCVAGEEIIVNININNNPGIVSLILDVTYDDMLTLESVDYNQEMGGDGLLSESLTSPVQLTWLSPLEECEYNGVFATLTFAVSEDAEIDQVGNINITYNTDNIFNLAEENVECSVENGQIVILPCVPGDINGDGKVNAKDATRLFQYIAGWNVEINEKALDTNGDGKVNAKDATRLFQSVAGWKVEIYAGKAEHIHTMNKIEAKEETHIEDGNIEYYTCTSCNKYYSDEDGIYEINYEDTIINKLVNVEIEFQVADGYIQWKNKMETEWKNLVSLETLAGADGENGEDGREVEFQVADGYLQWKYTTETEWKNLIELSTLVGAPGKDGEDGVDGEDGREVEFQVADGYLQWKYNTETEWKNLIELSTLVGTPGKDGEDGVDGEDGREVEFQVADGYLQWKYNTETEWKNLIELSTLVGAPGKDGEDGVDGEDGADGKDGREVEFQVADGYLQWKYNTETEWKNLIELSTLVGVPGKDGVYIESFQFNSTGELVAVMSDGSEVVIGKIPTCQHIYSDWKTRIEETCESLGIKERVCTICNNIEYEFVEQLGHDYDEWTILFTNCETKVCERKCKHCDANQMKSETGTWHEYEIIEVLPTCKEEGYKLYKCTKCGKSYTDTYTDKIDHEWEMLYIITSDCTVYEGVETCSMCGKMQYFNETPIIDHEYEEGKCVVCGEIRLSEGLEYTLNNDNNSYSVTGIGTCQDTELIIPSIYNGLPVISIGSKAFSKCTNLESITIPNSVTSIGENFYEGSSITMYYNGTIEDWCKISFSTPSANPMYHSQYFYMLDDNNKYNILTEIEIPDTITSIGDYQFYFSYVEKVIIPNSVTSIGEEAFYYCSSLTSIEIPNSVTSIGLAAFRYCTSLESITLPFVGNTLNGTSNTHFGYIFGASSDSYNNDYVPTSLKEVIITGGTSIGGYAFYNCTNLESVVIPTSVTSIGYNAFFNCSSLEKIELPNNITSIGYNSFYSCVNLESIEIPNSVTSIGYNAFCNCTSLESIELPNSIISIDYGVFSNCESLKEVIFEENSQFTSIEDWVFENCTSLTRIEIPNSVISLGSSVFSGCTNLESITIPFVGNTLNGTSNTHFGYIFGAPSSWDNNDYVPTSLEEIIITGGTSIDYRSFADCKSLARIEMPDSVISIGDYAFCNCESLENIVIPNSVTSIGQFAFLGCESLESITIPFVGNTLNGTSNTHFGWIFGAYSYSVNKDYVPTTLKEVIITGGTSIDYRSFADCTSIESIELPNSVTSIGEDAFNNCTGLTSIELPNSVTSIGEDAFNNCTGLASIELSNSVTSIGNHAFYNCISLTSIEFPTSVTSIGQFSFSGCTGLTSIEIPNSVTSIDYGAFCNCTSLVSIKLPFVGNTLDGTSDTYFGYIFGAYSYAANNTYVPTSLKEVIITGGTSIGEYAFYYCTSLISIEIPNSVTSIGDYVFHQCTNLKEVIFEENSQLTSIGSSVFNNCTSLTSIEIPNSVISIGSGAFQNCTSLTSMEIPNSVTTIGAWAFSDCTSLTINCAASSKPSGWDSKWNYSNCPVFWGYTE